MIPYGRQSISDADVDSVIQVLRSEFLTQGPMVPAFEMSVAARVDAPHAVAVNSATSALHLGCLALGLCEGDWLWTSPISFVASANCALYCGAQVDFVDIDPDTYNISTRALAEKLMVAKKSDKLPKVVIPVHFAGQSCDMEAIGYLSREFGFKVLEDASHAIGGLWKDFKIGSCQFSDVTVFSFHPVKIITTAEGGLLTTRNPEILQSLRDLRSHGITRDFERLDRQDQGAWYYEQHSLGFNYRMTELQAALGLSQLNDLDRFIARRHAIAARYENALADLPIIRPWQHPHSHSAFHLYVIRIDKGLHVDRRLLFDGLRASDILVNVHYIPIHIQPYYQRLGFNYGEFPIAEAYYDSAISLPIYASMSDDEQEFVITRLRELLR